MIFRLTLFTPAGKEVNYLLTDVSIENGCVSGTIVGVPCTPNYSYSTGKTKRFTKCKPVKFIAGGTFTLVEFNDEF